MTMDVQSYESVMRDTADEVRGLARHLAGPVLDGIKDGTKNLVVDWDGRGGGMFQQVNGKFAHHMTEIATALVDLGVLLDTVADGHKFVDAKIEGMMDIPQINLAGDNVGGNMIPGSQPTADPGSAARLAAMRG